MTRREAVVILRSFLRAMAVVLVVVTAIYSLFEHQLFFTRRTVIDAFMISLCWEWWVYREYRRLKNRAKSRRNAMN